MKNYFTPYLKSLVLHFSTKSYIYILFLMLGLHQFSKAQSCTPASIPYPHMGTNIPNATDMPWINLWHQINPSHSTFGGNGLVLGSDGWPTSKSNHNIVIGRDVALVYPIVGKIKISYKGTLAQLNNFSATNGITNLVSQANYPAPGYSYYEFDVNIPVGSVTGYELYMQFHNHVEDVKIMRPGFELDETQIIHPVYMNLLQKFTTFRWMPFLSTNSWYVDTEYACNTLGTVDWSIRSNANMPQSMVGTKGGSWEYVVWISNQFNKDLWINIPVEATDNYVTNLAQFLKDNLKPGLNVYMEIGNETWNSAGGFCSFRQLEHIYGNDWDAHRRFHGVRGKQVVDIFAGIWGWSEINNRIRMLIPGQIAYGVPGDGWAIGSSLDYLEQTFGADLIRRYFYATAAAPYFASASHSDVNTIIAQCQNNIDNDIFGEFSSEIWGGSVYMGNKLEGWLGRGGQYGLKLMAYEGGPDMDYTSGSGGVKAQAMADPRMKDLCLDYWNSWYSRYGYSALFNQFLATFNSSGLYTLGEDMNVTSTRQQAINQIVTSPSPQFDAKFRHTIPGIIDARKTSAYWSNWNAGPSLQYLRPPQPNCCGGFTDNRTLWTVAAMKNGVYNLAIEHQCVGNTTIDIFVDGVLVHNDLVIPHTSRWPGDWGFASWIYSNQPHPIGSGGSFATIPGVNIPLNLSYGVHVIKIQYWGTTDDNFRNLAFTLTSETPPFAPNSVTGDLMACNSQPDAKYTVEADQSVCSYKWVGLPGTASINPDAGGPGTGIARSGANTNLVYVNWGNTPNGNYNLTVFGINAVGTSPGRVFRVTVTTCGFTMAPNPVCTNTGVAITPAVLGATNYKWDFGLNSNPRIYTTSIAGTLPFNVVYTVSGSKTVTLVVTLSGGAVKTYLQNILIATSPTIGTISPSSQTACSGGAAVLSVSGTGSSFKWLYSTDGGTTYSAYPGATLPNFTFTGLSGTTYFKAAVTNPGCPTLTTAGSAVANISSATVSFAYGSTSYCNSSGTITPTGTFSGGSFSRISGPGSILLNTFTGTITLTGATAGVHTIRYFVPVVGACPSVAGTNTITITGGGNVNFILGAGSSICQSSGVSTYTANLTGTGSLFYLVSPTNSGSINSTNGQVNWSNTFSGISTITASVTGSSCGSLFTTHVVTVNPSFTPSITASSSQNGICSGTTVTFTGVPTNGGATPAYQWFVNGTPQGTNSTTYSYTPSNNDQVSVRLTSNALCASPTTATSSIITMSVSGTVTPTAQISTNTPTICAGQMTQFTSTISGGGATPTYQWQVNGSNVGTNSNTYTTTGLTSGQTVRLILTSSSACASPTSATSTGVTMTVNPNLTPSVSIAALQNNVCSGTGMTFVATPTNGGVSPTYQWKLNGSNVGTNSATLTGSTFSNGDVVSLSLISSVVCPSVISATSNNLTLTINPNLTPSITASSSQNGI
ncbi:MAG: hypothetical protein SFY32_10810, partial [Bacteroidota bacterium]|nr:hypothetical protein [Bacteroidota bacterium]